MICIRQNEKWTYIWPDAHVWSVPGGYSPPGEPLAERVRRELREEAGLEVEVGELEPYMSGLKEDPAGVGRAIAPAIQPGVGSDTVALFLFRGSITMNMDP